MAQNKSINLNMLKDEIDNRKREKNQVSTEVNGVNRTMSARDGFLTGLLESFQTGRDTHSSVVVKEVVNKVAEKAGEKTPIRQAATLPPMQNQPSQPQRITEMDMSPERDEQLYYDLEKKRKQTLVESLEGFAKTPQMGTPMNNQPMNNGNGMMINEAYLTENVKNVVNNYLAENFGPIIEESIKSTILEMYAVERIKEVLHENKDLIRTVVIETIKEIQAKTKAKAQS